jgi:metal-responsive CopG/Arc/MetJ family transcriptional regulator
MATIQVVLDKKLLKAADSAAKRQNLNRSALIREALQNHLKHLHELQLEDQDRRGYLAQPNARRNIALGRMLHRGHDAKQRRSPPVPISAT